MKFKERMEKFLELQSNNIDFENISKELGITQSTLRTFLNKRGYKWDNGKYILKEENITNEKITKKSIAKKAPSESKKLSNKVNPKKDRKINIMQDDLDKLCEVYDWYLQVKDYKSMKPRKSIVNKKDINIEEQNLSDLKSTSIKVDKKVWEDFERLCSNSQFTKQEIVTQALKDFMKEYRHLI